MSRFLKKFFLNLYYWPVFALVTLLGILLLPAIILVNRLFWRRRVAAAMRRAIRFYGWVLVRLVPFFGPTRLEYIGERPDRPSVFVANHNSAIDPYLFGMIPIENSFVTSWAFKIPVYQSFMNVAGYANAFEGWDEVCRKGKMLLDAGSSVTIWPEGHRSRDGSLGRFKNGAFALAVESGVPVVPVCLLGSGRIMAPGEFFLNPGRVQMLVLPAEYPDISLVGERQKVELKRRVQKVIEKKLHQYGHFEVFSVP
ncbi:MAG: 1-acyl-sn-glycerol-3-phosphate acyltransferase [Desulfobacterales bacterium]|nr:MAG: 1-acyl-sn-glycerol-3-phosphate acyltransferase [Desulfobacterales bacterium]